jgi:pyridoxal phosphate enzyme (YggS family)
MSVESILSDRIARVRGRIADAARTSGRDPSAVALVGVTKTVDSNLARAAFELGLHDLGESKPQELQRKAAAVPEARWHLIGHLQRNKIDRTAPLAALIHSVDSVRLLEALASFGAKHGSPVPVLLEVNCSREESKGGFAPAELPAIGDTAVSLAGISLQGLMTMAAFHDDPEQCRPAFDELRELRDSLRTRTGLPLPHLSMGMSNDYAVAVEEGATLVRVGTTLFEGLGAV